MHPCRGKPHLGIVSEIVVCVFLQLINGCDCVSFASSSGSYGPVPRDGGGLRIVCDDYETGDQGVLWGVVRDWGVVEEEHAVLAGDTSVLCGSV